MAKGKNSKAWKSKAVRDSVERDVSVGPAMPKESAEEDPVEEQDNEMDDEVDVEEAPESTDPQEGDVEHTRKRRNRRRRNRKRINSLVPDNSRNERNQTEISGVIFMCNPATKKDCFKHHVFGFPEAKKGVVEEVKKGMKLFLFDVDRKLLYGIYKASSEGGMDLVPEAFRESGRKFPAQVRFRIHKDCMPLEEHEFKQAIKENYFLGSRFKNELTSEQVGKLIQLFCPLDSKGLPQPRSRHDAQRQPASQDTQKEPDSCGHSVRHVSRGPPRVPPRAPRDGSMRHVSRSAREPVYAREYLSLYMWERLPTEFDLHPQSNYVPVAQVAEADAAYLRLQEADALASRRSYGILSTGQ